MFEGYTFFNNGSEDAQDMEKFFDENGIEYCTIYKSSDSRTRVFPPKNQPPYDLKHFNSLKKLILEGLEEKVN